MQLEHYRIEPAQLGTEAALWRGPLAVVDLAAVGEVPDAITLPPCPVVGVGVGNAAHPLTVRLDCVIEQPVGLAALAAQVLAQPEAAAVAVALLRLLPGMTMADGLVAESLAYGLLQGSAGHRRWLARREAAPMAAPGAVGCERHGDTLAITLARPWAGNAIDAGMRDALAEGFGVAALDPSITRISLRAKGRAFCLGADLAEFGTTSDPATAHGIRQLALPARVIAACAGRLEVHVDGACVGAGLEMAAFAARLTASPRAWFQLPELAMGLLPGAGGCVSLVRRIGRQRSALMILSGRRISARTALGWGLVDGIMDEGPGDDGGGDIG